MNIVYSSDNNFADVMGVSIISLFENNKETAEIVVYIIDNNISDENKDKLSIVANAYKRKLIFIPIPDIVNLVGVDLDTQRWSISAFSRLFIELIIPENIDKIIYLDCDTMIRHSLEDLYNIELDNNYYCAAVSMGCGRHNTAVGLSSYDKWFNSGVMLISLKKWRENHLHKKFIDFIKQHNGKIPCVDEGVINGTINSQIMILQLHYNVWHVFFTYQSSTSYIKYNRYLVPITNFYDDDTFNKVRNDPYIVHFIFSEILLRPWIKPYFMYRKHPYAPEWLKYRSISPWAKNELHQNNGLFLRQMTRHLKRLIVKISNLVLDILPKGISKQINDYVIKIRTKV